MKCLSVCQPYADLIVRGEKTIELRSWNTKFRGEFLVHAAQRVLGPDCGRLGMRPASLASGAIIGKATLYDVKRYGPARELAQDQDMHRAGPEFRRDGMYGFLLRAPKRFRVPIPYRGSLGFFEARLPDIAAAPSDPDRRALTEIMDEEHRYRLVGHH